jgi:hypothetical protein
MALQLMTEHGLDVKKGWFDMASLDYSASLNSSITAEVNRGSVVHVDSSGTFSLGASNTAPAIFLLNGSSDADVSNPGTTAAGNFMHQAVAPTGKLSGLVATGGYEISSTEFDATQTYVPGELLTSTTGVLTNQTAVQFVNPIVGVVSGAHSPGTPAKNHNGIASLSFWSVWLPGAA